jgi:hypothetical protein
MSKWFAANKLALNLDKTNIRIGYNDKYIEESVHTKFLGLQIENHLNWKNHIDQLVPKLSRACYAVRSLLDISNTDSLKSIYFANFQFLLKYGIIFWGNSIGWLLAGRAPWEVSQALHHIRPLMGEFFSYTGLHTFTFNKS